MLDAGIVAICTVHNGAERGDTPLRVLCIRHRAYFGTRTVGMSRFFAARQASVRVDKLIRIWRDAAPDVSTQDMAVIGNEVYFIRQVQTATDDDEMPVFDLTLERTVDKYDIRAI